MAKEGGVKTMRKFKDIEISYAEKKEERKKNEERRETNSRNKIK